MENVIKKVRQEKIYKREPSYHYPIDYELEYQFLFQPHGRLPEKNRLRLELIISALCVFESQECEDEVKSNALHLISNEIYGDLIKDIRLIKHWIYSGENLKASSVCDSIINELSTIKG